MISKVDDRHVKIISTMVAKNDNGGGTSASKSPDTVFDNENKNKNIDEFCEKLGITLGQYQDILDQYPDFLTLSPEKQLAIVKEIISPVTTEQDTSTKQPESTPVIENNEETSVFGYDYITYNSSSREEKIKTCYSELARNTFVYGYKSSDGKIDIPATSKEAWENLSEDEKQKYTSQITEAVKNIPDLAKIETASKSEKSIDGLDAIARSIQVANSLDMSYSDFLKLDEATRTECTENYIQDLKNQVGDRNLSDSDKAYLEHIKELKCAMSDVLGKKLPEDISVSELIGYAKDYNIIGFEEIIKHLQKEKSLTKAQEKQINEYNSFVNTEAGKYVLNTAKAARVPEMDAELSELQRRIDNKEELTEKEIKHYERLKDYLGTEEANNLRQCATELPTPKTDYEKNIIEELNKEKAVIRGTVNDEFAVSKLECNFIANNMKGMSLDEQKKYLETCIIYNNDASSVYILEEFAKKDEFKYLLSLDVPKSIICVARGNFGDETSTEYIAEGLEKTAELAKSGSKLNKDKFLAASSTILRSDPVCNGELDDASMNIYNKVIADNADILAPEQSDELMCLAADMSTKIRDEKLQAENIEYRQKSSAYSDVCAKHDIDILDQYHENNRYDALDGATNGRAEVTAYATENGAVTKLGAKDQERGYSLLQNRVNEYFTGEDVNKYSSALADQIKNCDATVQAKLVDKVYASGNEAAIEKVILNIGKYAPVVDTQITQSIINAVSDIDVDKEYNELTKDFKILTLQEYNSLTPSEKLEYKTKYFLSLSSTKQIEILANLPSSSDKKRIYEQIASSNEGLLIKLIEHDAGTAKYIFEHGIGDKNLVINIVKPKSLTQNGYADLWKDIKATKSLAFVDGNPKTARTLNLYVENPIDDTKYIFKKDKFGNLMV